MSEEKKREEYEKYMEKARKERIAKEIELKEEILKTLEDVENCSLKSSCDCPPQDDIYYYEDEERNPHEPTQENLEFTVRKRKAEIIYEKMKEEEYPITPEGLQHFVWDNIKLCIIRPSDLDKNLWDLQYHCMPDLFKDDEKLRCLAFCRFLRKEQAGDLTWSYWEGRSILQKECTSEEAIARLGTLATYRGPLRPLREDEPINRLNTKAMKNEVLAHNNYYKENLASINVGDLKADLWRISPELQKQFPTETELVPDPETGEPRIAPKQKGVLGFIYTHEGWLNMPDIKTSPVEQKTIGEEIEEEKKLKQTEKGRKKFYEQFDEY